MAVVDADGVALAAIQGLHTLISEKDSEIQDLKSRLAGLEAMVSKLAGIPSNAKSPDQSH